MIRNNKQWSEWCHRRGTSGDQVFQILQDWRESEGIVNQECEWRIDEESSEIKTAFYSDCGNVFYCYEQWPREEGFYFCPFCGNEIVVERIGDE